MNTSEIMVTVKILAYNHEKYIVQAIESILSQKTEYRYEILIGEDCSTDSTREIVDGYAQKYPDIIRVIHHKRNVGCTKNAYSLDIHARGKYVAGCEGDDYWCDDLRIQKDVDFLETHPEYVGVCHRCRVVDGNDDPIEENTIPSRTVFWKFDKEVYTLADYERWEVPGHSMTKTSRNLFRQSEKDYSIVYKASKRVSDRTHLLMEVVEGNIYCMPDVVGCYRYRVSDREKNFMSVQGHKNLKAEDFLMMRRLEHWAKVNKGISLDLCGVKKDRLAGSVAIFMRYPTRENFCIILKIVRYSGETLTYIGYVIKTVLIKLYQWKILKEDRIVNL
ncbi:MAG: glycosyltransferase [bacterium]|nr:glycosyltransferase [bacterium]MCM1374638.1 glycosyltransferase [Muribaculum sp.]